jgi:hypothetical protein
MSTIHFHQTTTSTSEQYVAGSPTSGRAARSVLATAPTSTSRCIAGGRTEADVTEGSGGIWERLHYDFRDTECK